MFRLRVSNTLLSCAVAAWAFGPGIGVAIIGADGSSTKYGASPIPLLKGLVAAVAEAYWRNVHETGGARMDLVDALRVAEFNKRIIFAATQDAVN